MKLQTKQPTKLLHLTAAPLQHNKVTDTKALVQFSGSWADKGPSTPREKRIWCLYFVPLFLHQLWHPETLPQLIQFTSWSADQLGVWGTIFPQLVFCQPNDLNHFRRVLRHVRGEDGQSIRIPYECCKCRTLFIDSVSYILFLRLSHRNMQFSSDSYKLYLIFMVITTDYISIYSLVQDITSSQ